MATSGWVGAKRCSTILYEMLCTANSYIPHRYCLSDNYVERNLLLPEENNE